jgi:hypothetical protein
MKDLIAKDGDLRGVFVSDPITAEVVAQAGSRAGRRLREGRRPKQNPVD